LGNDEKLKLRVQALLSEYHACHLNRNHFDTLRWTIGSIFIAASLALLSISFLQDVKDSPQGEVEWLALFSLLLMVVWFVYHRYTNRFVVLSLQRMWNIEESLRNLDVGLDTELHTFIKKKTRKGLGRLTTWLFFMTIFGAWLARIYLLHRYHGMLLLDFFGIIALLLIVHLSQSSAG